MYPFTWYIFLTAIINTKDKFWWLQGAKGLVGTGRKVTNPVKAGYPKQLEY